MGQKYTVDLLPKSLRDRIISMIDDPASTQLDMVEAINTEMGEKAVTRSSVNLFVTGIRRQREEVRNTTSAEKSLLRIALALERIAESHEKSYPS